MYRPLLTGCLILLLTGCVETMQQFNQDLASLNSALATAPASANQSGGSSPDLAPISQDQLSKIDAALAVKNKNNNIAEAISEATPVIRNFTKTIACITGGSGRSLDAYAAPRASFGLTPLPMHVTRYHNKSTCLSVLRIHGWTMPARNALKFEVVYVADDSGESAKTHHEVVKQPSGEWLFTR